MRLLLVLLANNLFLLSNLNFSVCCQSALLPPATPAFPCLLTWQELFTISLPLGLPRKLDSKLRPPIPRLSYTRESRINIRSLRMSTAHHNFNNPRTRILHICSLPLLYHLLSTNKHLISTTWTFRAILAIEMKFTSVMQVFLLFVLCGLVGAHLLFKDSEYR